MSLTKVTFSMIQGAVVNAQDYGANTSAANNAAAIQSAINAVSALGGGTVYIPTGVYNVQSAIDMKSNVTVKGDGKTSVLKVNSASAFNIFEQDTDDLVNVVFDGIAFDGSMNYPANSQVYKQTYTLRNGAILTNDVKVTNFTVKNCYFNEMSYNSIELNGYESSQIRILNNYFYKGSYVWQCINLQIPSLTFTESQMFYDFLVEGNTINICGPQYHYDASKEDWVGSTDAIIILSGKNGTVANNVVSYSGGCGIRVETSYAVTVVGNAINESGQNGILFYKALSTGNTCTGNTVRNWGRIPFAYAIRNYSGTYVYAEEFPSPGSAPLPVNPTTSPWFSTWDYSLQNINTSTIIAYSDTDYYVSQNNGILPFRGYSAIGVVSQATRTAIVGNTCIGAGTAVDGSGDYLYASNWGFSPVHPNNFPSGAGLLCTVTGNQFSEVLNWRIYHPVWEDPINTRGALGDAIYVGNRDNDQTLISTPLVRVGADASIYANTLNFLSTSTSIRYGTSAPSTGTWTRGTIIFATQPSAGGKIGWVCTASGTPGTWNLWGAIDP
jgi:parallel beta-helix repeat protein